MYYVDTLKCELIGTNAYKLQASLCERVVVDGHGCHTALKFGVNTKENKDKFHMLYWLLKLDKIIKSKFFANSSSCTTTELSKVLSSCLNDTKNMLLSTAKRYMKEPVRIYIGLLKIQTKY